MPSALDCTIACRLQMLLQVQLGGKLARFRSRSFQPLSYSFSSSSVCQGAYMFRLLIVSRRL